MPSNHLELKILLVDDSEDNLFLLKKMIQHLQPCELHCAHNGLEAIELYKQIHPDLVLMDIEMPKMDGIQALRVIQEENRLKKSKLNPYLVAMTSYVAPHEISGLLEQGFHRHLSKPVSLSSLLHLLIECAVYNNSQSETFLTMTKTS